MERWWRNIESLSILLRACHQCSHHSLPLRTFVTQVSADLPRITVPHTLQSRILKLRQRQKAHVAEKKVNFKSPLVISCKRHNFNHHRGQTYIDFGPKTLASYGWKHRKSAGDYFTILSHNKNPALSDETEGRFEDLQLNEDVVKAAQNLGHSVPTSIQAAAIPVILRGVPTVCAAETGSGKTLAYLLPALNMLLHRKRLITEYSESYNMPSVIILAPSRELADQIMGVIESLQQHLPFTAYKVCGGRGTKARLAWPVKRQMDLLIATPGVLNKLLSVDQFKISGLQQVILDEADTLLDDSFVDIINRILYKLKIPAVDTVMSPGNVEDGAMEEPISENGFVGGVQFVLVSATMPKGLDKSIGAYIPVTSLKKVTSSYLHHLMPHIPQKFLRLLPSQKPGELMKTVLADNKKKAGGTMIFCNNSTTCFYLGHVLREHGVQSALINGEMTEKSRSGVFERFQEGRSNILVATDIASRGLDTLDVHHVINYDFPNFISDYIHRAGRVGRVGSRHSGLVTSFVTHKWEVDLLWQIEISARKSTDLHNVNANIKRKLIVEHAKRHGTPMDGI